MTLEELCYIDDTGYHYVDYPTVLEFFKEQYRDIYGSDVYLESDSQDGQWIAIVAKALYDSFQRGEVIYNSFNPTFARGSGLSRIVKINGIKRQVPTKSEVDLLIVGQVGTTINNGIAQDELGQNWLLPSVVVIPVAGEITITAQAENEGATAALPNTINKIYTPTLGWQSVNNPSSAVEGNPVEEDSNLRRRQTSSTALPSLTVFEGTIGGVENITGVTRLKGYENDTNVTDADGLPPHSISLVVEGGDVQEIANEIARRKTPGTYTYGTTSVNTYDKYNQLNIIRFFRPTIIGVKVKITLEALDGYTSSIGNKIKAAVAAAINNLSIGDDVYLNRLYVPANLSGQTDSSTFNINDIEIAKLADSLGHSNIVIAFNEAATIEIVNIEIEVV